MDNEDFSRFNAEINDIGVDIVNLLEEQKTSWVKAIIRIQFEDGITSCKSIYFDHNLAPSFIPTESRSFRDKIWNFSDDFQECVFERQGKSIKVILLVFRLNESLKVFFDYENINAWHIGRIDQIDARIFP